MKLFTKTEDFLTAVWSEMLLVGQVVPVVFAFPNIGRKQTVGIVKDYFQGFSQLVHVVFILLFVPSLLFVPV